MPQEGDMKQVPSAVVQMLVVAWNRRPRYVHPWFDIPEKNILLNI
jgi:hypothetical protein